MKKIINVGEPKIFSPRAIKKIKPIIDTCGEIIPLTSGDENPSSNVAIAKTTGATEEHHHKKGNEYYYIISGNGQIFLNNKKHRLTPGTLVFIPRGVKHKLISRKGETVEYVVFSDPAWSALDVFLEN